MDHVVKKEILFLFCLMRIAVQPSCNIYLLTVALTNSGLFSSLTFNSLKRAKSATHLRLVTSKEVVISMALRTLCM